MTPAVEGPSFPVAAKALASAVVALMLVGGAVAFVQVDPGKVDHSFLLLNLMLAGVVGVGYWRIMTDRTRFDGQHLEQRGLWTRRVAVADITQVLLIEPPLLAWLVVPRLRVRTRGTRLMTTTFHLGDARVLAQVRLLAHGVRASTPP